ncbi:unnamed protein product [Dovyalis caffra]|uniref:Uncharacterized protein n=1 Tax=Dovyalis caffra TaxID=77055 RepID=A0AAV1SLU1_9ROSI|nr:unnamed protein product [Dovyalis caffra]
MEEQQSVDKERLVPIKGRQFMAIRHEQSYSLKPYGHPIGGQRDGMDWMAR